MTIAAEDWARPLIESALAQQTGEEQNGYLHIFGSIIDGNIDLMWNPNPNPAYALETCTTYGAMEMSHERYQRLVNNMPEKWHTGGNKHPHRFKYAGQLRTILEVFEQSGHFAITLMWEDRFGFPVFACKEPDRITTEDVYEGEIPDHAAGCRACAKRNAVVLSIIEEDLGKLIRDEASA